MTLLSPRAWSKNDAAAISTRSYQISSGFSLVFQPLRRGIENCKIRRSNGKTHIDSSNAQLERLLVDRAVGGRDHDLDRRRLRRFSNARRIRSAHDGRSVRQGTGGEPAGRTHAGDQPRRTLQGGGSTSTYQIQRLVFDPASNSWTNPGDRCSDRGLPPAVGLLRDMPTDSAVEFDARGLMVQPTSTATLNLQDSAVQVARAVRVRLSGQILPPTAGTVY